MKIVSLFGHLVRELIVYYQYIAKACKRPVIFISVSDSVLGFSSDLRGKRLVSYWRSKGINALLIPSQLDKKQRNRLASLIKPEVVIHQKFRTAGNDPRIYKESINILDLDDADFLNTNLLPHMESSLRLCDGGVGGSRYTRDWIKKYVNNTAVVWTGSGVVCSLDQSLDVKGNNIIWAITSPLDNRAEADFVKSVLVECAKKQTFNFIVIGRGNTDEIKKFFEPILTNNKDNTLTHYPFLPYEKFISILKTGVIGLAPLFEETNDFNKGKSFGKILAYLSAGLPVLTSSAADHEIFFKNGVNGYVSNDQKFWVESIEALLNDVGLRKVIIKNATADYNSRLSLEMFSTLMLDFISKTYEKKYGSPIVLKNK